MAEKKNKIKVFLGVVYLVITIVLWVAIEINPALTIFWNVWLGIVVLSLLNYVVMKKK